MPSLFPEPTTAEKVASVEHLLRDAQNKAHTARRARDQDAANYWLGEMVRLQRLRSDVIGASQIDMLADVSIFHQQQET